MPIDTERAPSARLNTTHSSNAANPSISIGMRRDNAAVRVVSTEVTGRELKLAIPKFVNARLRV
ncbi:hypothetical protein GCM10009764_66480 [Nocardia ninae]|uniref:Uncharacterized protein n=1 Tax=Nocardia ninae NBRC 108245 TaxID=1210091 RepID=A0A511M9N9_9NOCA|nr:hypothetical protein NN4_09550 [Nocardia ninae NBRC 108245]